MEHGERISPCVWTAITRTLYHAARSSSTAICPVSISGIKISAYFSIISARKLAKALHSSKLDVQAETGKISFSLAGYFFNRRLYFLVAGQCCTSDFIKLPFKLIQSILSAVPASPVRFLCGNLRQCMKSERTFLTGGHRFGHARYPADAGSRPVSGWS